MKCIFCEKDNVSTETNRSYEKHLGDNVFFEYMFFKCNSCYAEFINNELSEFNVKSYAEMRANLNRKLIKISNSNKDIFKEYENKYLSMRSIIYNNKQWADNHIKANATDVIFTSTHKSINKVNYCHA